jgi:hypothetical protein
MDGGVDDIVKADIKAIGHHAGERASSGLGHQGPDGLLLRFRDVRLIRPGGLAKSPGKVPVCYPSSTGVPKSRSNRILRSS